MGIEMDLTNTKLANQGFNQQKLGTLSEMLPTSMVFQWFGWSETIGI